VCTPPTSKADTFFPLSRDRGKNVHVLFCVPSKKKFFFVTHARMDGSQHIPARHTLFVSSIPPNLPPEEFAAPFQTIEDYLDARLTQDRNGEYVLFFFFSFPSFSTHPIRLVISFLVLVNGDGAH